MTNWLTTQYWWQFKNGTIGPIQPSQLTHIIIIDKVKTRHAWDRSLGGYVFYEK